MTPEELERRVAALEAKERQDAPPDPGPRPIEPGAIYTVKEVAERLRCESSNVYNLVESKTLATVRVGNGGAGIRILGSDLLAFVTSRRQGGHAPRMALKRLGL